MIPIPPNRRYARLAQFLLVAFLAVPALSGIWSAGQGTLEQRRLAEPPARPDSWNALLSYPASFDAWAGDHFGLRDLLVRWNGLLRYHLFQQFPTFQVIAGKHGRVFLAAHRKVDMPYAAILSSCGFQVDHNRVIVDQFNQLAALTRAEGLHAGVLAVPSAPVVQMNQLPSWLERLCRASTPPISRALADPGLSPQGRALVYFPLREMQRAGLHADLFPRTWFHWYGAGPRLVSGLSVAHLEGGDADRGTPLVSRVESLPSDLSNMFPGMDLRSQTEVIDFAASGVDACVGPDCFGEVKPVMDKLWQMATYRNPKAAGGRLVLLADSFGMGASGWYSRYYKEVIFVCTNGIERLDAAELARMRGYLFADKSADVIFLYHDVSIHHGRINADSKLLFPAG